MHGTTHLNELIWYFDTHSTVAPESSLLSHAIALGGLVFILTQILVLVLNQFGGADSDAGARISNCHGQSNAFESDVYHYKLKHVTAKL